MSSKNKFIQLEKLKKAVEELEKEIKEMDEDTKIDEYFDALSKIERKGKIKHSSWSLVDEVEKQELRDFSAKHPFTATMVDAGCGGESRCYCIEMAGMKPCKPTPLTGDTWLDVWKSIDLYCKQKKCPHTMIEEIKQEGDVLKVHCGS